MLQTWHNPINDVKPYYGDMCVPRVPNLGHKRAMSGPKIFLKEWRKHFGLNQQQLADRMVETDPDVPGIDQSKISRVENADRKWDSEFLGLAAKTFGSTICLNRSSIFSLTGRPPSLASSKKASLTASFSLSSAISVPLSERL